MAQNDIDIAPNNTQSGNNPVATNTFTWNGKTCNSEMVNIASSTGVVASVTASNALKVDNSAVTQPISAASLPLPTGAAQDGVDGTGITAPTGGSGIRGWLSGIYKAVTGTLTATISGALPAGSNNIGTVNVNTLPALPAGGNAIGSVSVSNFPGTQPVSGTITANAGTGTFTVAGTVSSNATLLNGPGQTGSGTGQFIPCSQASVAINCGAAATQTLVTGVAGQNIYITHFDFVSNGSGTVQLAYGATPTALSGAYATTAETGVSAGSGYGAVAIVPVGQDLKIVTTTSATAQGIISYAQY